MKMAQNINMDLASKHCVPCEGGMPPMPRAQAEELLGQVFGWELVDAPPSRKASEGQVGVLKIEKNFKFKNFEEALEFVNKVGRIAEKEGHHPDISFGWGRAKITLYTHAVAGLSENDFILAAKINKIPNL